MVTPVDGFRCLPKHTEVNTYLDSGCSIPVYLHKSPCAAVPKWYRVDGTDGDFKDMCGPKKISSQMYSVGVQQSGIATYYMYNADGICDSNIFGNIQPTWSVFSMIKEAPMIEFALASYN
jgi:hypothetical protein